MTLIQMRRGQRSKAQLWATETKDLGTILADVFGILLMSDIINVQVQSTRLLCCCKGYRNLAEVSESALHSHNCNWVCDGLH